MKFRNELARSSTRLALLTITALSIPTIAHAQLASQLQLGMPRVEQRAAPHRTLDRDTPTLQSRLRLDSIPPSRWKTGMIIGGVFGGVVAFLLVDAANHIGDTPTSITPLGLLGPVAVFALIGGLIGSGFH